MRALRWFSIAVAIAALLAPAAHVLEMPNKLHMDGLVWLQVQQQLYRGWGPFIGAPTEIAGVVVNALLVFDRSSDVSHRRLRGLVASLYLAMIIVFFVFNEPVNTAVGAWSAATLPANWADFRSRWELGHALAAFLALISLLLVLRMAAASTTNGRA
jgi:hypothetical protein